MKARRINSKNFSSMMDNLQEKEWPARKMLKIIGDNRRIDKYEIQHELDNKKELNKKFMAKE